MCWGKQRSGNDIWVNDAHGINEDALWACFLSLRSTQAHLQNMRKRSEIVG